MQGRTYLPILFAGLGVLAGASCNAITGADDFTIDKHRASKDDGDGGSDTGGGGITTTGVGGGTSSGGGTTTTAPPQAVGAAPGVFLAAVRMYQGLERPLMEGGAPASSSIPVVAGRDALVRIFVATDGSYNGAPVVAHLFVGDGATPLEVIQPATNSTQNNMGSTFNFQVPGALIQPGAGYRVELGFANATGAPAAYPAQGYEALPAQSSGAQVRVKLVPVAYGADGSNRLPDTSDAQIQRYHDRFLAMYPVPAVEITVHAAVNWQSSISAYGNGWDSLLNSLANLRAQEGAPDDVYYYGIFEPASSFGQFCGGGCVAGLGMIGDPGDSYSRAAIGLGYTGEESADTAVHEVGHNHGRQHAPCGGASGVDPGFPHPGAQIGVWGFDRQHNQLVDPSVTDLMGYCFPIWISDYTFSALFNRIKQVNGAQIVVPQDQLDRTYEQIAIAPDGTATWNPPMKLHRPPMGEAKTVTLATASGPITVTGAFFPYDHLDGGILFVQQPADVATGLSVDLDGKLVQLFR